MGNEEDRTAVQQVFRGIGSGPAIGPAAAACCALAALPSPAAAADARAVLTVTATVLPACAVAQRPGARHNADIACSTGARLGTMTSASNDEQPLREAAALLGRPLRSDGSVRLTAPVAPASATAGTVEGGTRYLTVTY